MIEIQKIRLPRRHKDGHWALRTNVLEFLRRRGASNPGVPAAIGLSGYANISWARLRRSGTFTPKRHFTEHVGQSPQRTAANSAGSCLKWSRPNSNWP